MKIEIDPVIDINKILCFVHIPKSGGSTLREGLFNYFNPNEYLRLGVPLFTHYIDINNTSNVQSEAKQTNNVKLYLKKIPLLNFIYDKIKNSKNLISSKKNDLVFRDFYSLTKEELQRLRFISSIQERNIIPPILGKEYLYILLIREPSERIQSYYFEAKRNKSNRKPYIQAAKKYNIDDFVKYLFDERPHIVCNPYSRCISGTEKFEITRKIIDDQYYLAAPIEKMDDFCRLITLKFFGKPQTFDKKRVGENNPKKNIISDNINQLIISKNQSDINLKKHITSEFDRIFKDYFFK